MLKEKIARYRQFLVHLIKHLRYSTPVLQKPKRPPVNSQYLTILGRDQAEKCAFLYECQIPPKTLFNPFQKRALIFTCLKDKSFENTVGKGEIARASNFFFSHSNFSFSFYLLGELSSIFIHLKLSSANSFSLEQSKICRLGKS